MKTQEDKGRRLLGGRRVTEEEEEEGGAAAANDNNNGDKSFTSLHRTSWFKKQMMATDYNKLNNNSNNNHSTSCPQCYFDGGGERVVVQRRRKRRRGSGSAISNSMFNPIITSSKDASHRTQSHHHPYSYTGGLGVGQLLILTLLTLLVLLDTNIINNHLHSLTLCSAQKLIFGKSHNPLQIQQNLVIPHIKYGQGLNKWSFLSVDRDNHGLHSDLLCPNPMMTKGTYLGYNRAGTGGVTTRVNPGRGSKQNSNSQQQPQQPQTPTYYQPPQQPPQYPQSRFPGSFGAPSLSQQTLPNEIWAMKTDELLSILPCSLRQYAAVPPPFSSPGNNANVAVEGMVMMNTGSGSGGATRHNNGHFIENRILFINLSLVPFNFHGAIPCSKYIKLMYDEEEGTDLQCGHIPFDPQHENKYHINWPIPHNKRKDYFSLLDNLERFLKNEQSLHRQFYFQIYFTSFNGRSKRCSVQQYELDLSYPAGNARFCNLSQANGGHEELCGEFHCSDLIFPLYTDPEPHTGHHGGRHEGKSGSGKHRDTSGSGEDLDVYGDEEDYDDEEEGVVIPANKEVTDTESNSLGQTHGGHQAPQGEESEGNFSWSRMIRMDMRLLIFFTIVPLVLFGVLVFGLELIVYFMCCRKRRGEDDEGGTRSQQLLENSLNVWENVPSRMDAQRTVSFSPMTTSIYGERKSMQMMMDATSLESHPETPKILKSALKSKPGGGGVDLQSSPTSAAHHYFDYHHDHDMPPSYIETTTR